MPRPLERTIERHLTATVRVLGGAVRKVQWVGRRNAPDRLVMIPGYRSFFIELKRPGKYPTPAQAREIQTLNNAGLLATWANSELMIGLAISAALQTESQR